MTEATNVRELPILFSAPMVKAILDGRKTQTRRVIDFCTPKKDFRFIDGRVWVALGEQEYDPRTKKTIFGGECRLEENGMFYAPIVIGKGPNGEGNPARCPYGVPGDRLWVRETFAVHAIMERLIGREREWRAHVSYKADRNANWHSTDEWGAAAVPIKVSREVAEKLYDDIRTNTNLRWKSGRFMPRWASRITLEITDVRVERLQSISEEDARAEGVPFSLIGSTHRIGFENLWNSIHGCNAFSNANPWVWAISFRLAEPRA